MRWFKIRYTRIISEHKSTENRIDLFKLNNYRLATSHKQNILNGLVLPYIFVNKIQYSYTV